MDEISFFGPNPPRHFEGFRQTLMRRMRSNPERIYHENIKIA